MELHQLKELILPVKKEPQTTLALRRAVKSPEETVSLYYFPDSIRNIFESILTSITHKKGLGYWIQAEYGVGKTHFLATLTCILSDTSKKIWSCISDPEINSYCYALKDIKLFPVVIQLRGEAGADEHTSRSLLERIEMEIERALDERKLSDKVAITTSDELLNWYEGLEETIKNSISNFAKQQIDHGFQTIYNLDKNDAASIIRKYCQHNNLRPNISISIRERLHHIFNQIVNQSLGFTGILVVIDEYESWQSNRPADTPEGKKDNEVLETLGFLLPKDFGLEIYTIVASQTEPPAQLRGSHAEDRFTTIELMAQKESEKDYNFIVTHRVRNIIKEMIPEIKEYFHFYYENFQFLKDETEENFCKMFPFQPRCFEIVRRITNQAKELPGVRLGINIFYDLLKENEILNNKRLVVPSDLLRSKNLLNAARTSLYRPSFDSYVMAYESLGDLDIDQDDLPLAQKIVDTLFLTHLAYILNPRYMTEQEIAEATLVLSDYLNSQDVVKLILTNLAELPHISYETEKGAIFEKVKETTKSPVQIFNAIKRDIKSDDEIEAVWERCLLLPAYETGGDQSLFGHLTLNQPKSENIEFNRISYTGEIIVAPTLRDDLLEKIRKDNCHFRIVFLTHHTNVDLNKIEDTRIAICVPNKLASSYKEITTEYMAVQLMETEYKNRTGPEAEESREWASEKRRRLLKDILTKQVSLYRLGNIFTKRDIAIEAKEVFSEPQQNKRISKIGVKLLENVYLETPKLVDRHALKKVFQPNNAKNLFQGLIQGDSSTASTSSMDQFAVGLYLAKGSNPRNFNPEGSPLFEYFIEELKKYEENVQLWKIYEELTDIPYGLTAQIITLNILLFVRYGNPAVEILLQPQHNIILQSGQKPLENRLTAYNIDQLEWKPGMEKYFSSLTYSTDIPWNEVVPIAKIVNNNLKTAFGPAEIETQEKQLLNSLQQLKLETPRIRENLKLLSSKFSHPLNADHEKLLDQFKALWDIERYVQFYEKVKTEFKNEKEFETAYNIFRNLKKVSDKSATLITIKTFLDSLNFDDQYPKLDAQKMILTQRLALESLINSPHQCDGIAQEYEQFKRKYEVEYQKHHRDVNKKLAELLNIIKDLDAKHKALVLLNKIEELGQASGQGLKDGLENLKNRISVCPITELVSIKETESTVCATCQLSINYNPPISEVESLSNSINRSLEERSNLLAKELTNQLIKLDKKRQLDTLLKVIKISDISKLVPVITDELVQYIRELLQQANLFTVRSSVFASLSSKYKSISREEIPEVVQGFKQALENAFKKAEKDNPGKQVKITLD